MFFSFGEGIRLCWVNVKVRVLLGYSFFKVIWMFFSVSGFLFMVMKVSFFLKKSETFLIFLFLRLNSFFTRLFFYFGKFSVFETFVKSCSKVCIERLLRSRVIFRRGCSFSFITVIILGFSALFLVWIEGRLFWGSNIGATELWGFRNGFFRFFRLVGSYVFCSFRFVIFEFKYFREWLYRFRCFVRGKW